MNRKGRKLAAGWTFAAGTLFGVLAAFVVPTALHGSRSAAHADLPTAVTAATLTADTAPVVEADAPAAPRPAAASPAKTEKPKAQPSTRSTKSPDHSELDLQLD
jgi:hypothetical protein